MPMTVKKMIAELKKQPQNALVGYAHGDNSEHEVAGYCEYLILLRKADHIDTEMSRLDRECLDSLPEQIVIIRG